MRARLSLVLSLLVLATPSLATLALAAPQCPVPQRLSFQVEREVRRDTPGFTQGLEYHDGALFEGTGNVYGDTRINRIDMTTGKVTPLYDAGKDYFGEGLTFFGGRAYQLSWREGKVFVFDSRMTPLREMQNPRDGWGLTHDADGLIASDGSSRLFFLSPRDFTTRRSLRVVRAGRYVENLNELEYVDGAVWANIFESWNIVKIDPVSGCVTAEANLEGLRARMRPADRRYIESEANFVLNGIAHDPATGLFTLSGKYWPMLFTGRFTAN